MTVQQGKVSSRGQSGQRVRAVLMDDEASLFSRLTLLASGLALAPVNVQALQAASTLGRSVGLFAASTSKSSPLRPVLLASQRAAAPSPTQLLLPPLSEKDSVVRERVHMAMVAHAAAHLRYSPAQKPSNILKPMGMTVVSALEDARVERLLIKDYPGVRSWFESQLLKEPDELDLSFNAFMIRLDLILMQPARLSSNHWVNKAHELFEHAAQEHGLEDYAAFRAIASILANDLGQMRVRMDPQHYATPLAYRDDNSYLWEHPESEADDEDSIALQSTGARPPPPQQVQRGEQAEINQQASSVEFEIARFTYPEWDRKIERMKSDWCTVIEKLPGWQGLSAVPEMEVQAVSRFGAMLLPNAHQLDRRHRLRHQWEGDDVDLDAAIEVQVDRRLNLRPDPRLFARPGKGPRPTSMLVLLDISESVNNLASDGQSLLDIEKQAALLLSHSSVQGVDRLAIHAFSSNTRSEVNYYRLLDFGQSASQATTAMLRALKARFSTRLGAAVRHASNLLQDEPSGQRTMLVVTDGAPADVDVHDSRYLIDDARHAVQEAARAGVRVSCLAVDPNADDYVRHIFGWRNFGIADHAHQLGSRLTQMSARLAGGR
ncbi:VWA domain-containing protein [Comamonas sp. C24C]